MHYTVIGKVIKGDGYGRKLGFPTVNLDTLAKGISPGVYVGTVVLESKIYKAGIVVHEDNHIDAHLIGYDGDAYGSEIKLEIKKFLREFKKFDTEGELIGQIKKDIELCSQE